VRFSIERINRYFKDIWISPDGSKAIVIQPSVNAPENWADYVTSRRDFFAYLPDRRSSDPTALVLQQHVRYALVDTRTGRSQPLLKAPLGIIAHNLTPDRAFWIDRTHVIVSDTFLPLAGVDSAERARRVRGPAIAEVDVRTGGVTPIHWEPAASGSVLADARIRDIDFDRSTRTLTLAYGQVGHERTEAYRRSASGAWQSVATAAVMRPRLAVAVHEELNVRPKLVATSSRCGCEAEVWDPAPELDAYSFGHAEALTVRVQDGHDLKAVLIRPVGYVPGKRYPLILQTHDVESHQFLIDGPFNFQNGFAAQALANAGFAVLQIEIDQRYLNRPDEATRSGEGYRMIIQHMIDSGLADPRRIGVIAFSRTGEALQGLIHANPHLLAAAAFDDTGVTSYSGRLDEVNASADIMAQFNAFEGKPDLSDGLAGIAQIGLAQDISSTSTPVRFDSTSADSTIAMWELYAALRYQGTPAEFIYLPGEAHTGFVPRQRFSSQQGNVDWFRYWLQGYKDPDPTKATQYERWDRMKAARKPVAAN